MSAVEARRPGGLHPAGLTKESGPLVRHLTDAFADARTQHETPDIDTGIARKDGESLQDWLGRLRAMSVDAGGYRGASVDHLWHIAEEANTPLEQRVASVVVLASSEAARDRIRAIAARVVSPAVRSLFDAVADDAGEEQLARLLQPLLASQKIAV